MIDVVVGEPVVGEPVVNEPVVDEPVVSEPVKSHLTLFIALLRDVVTGCCYGIT
jgi:hypothetical protein